MAVIGTFGSFTAARLGIYASQSSLNVTGNNIANINTKGYTRQRMDLVSLHSYGNARYANSYNLNIGYGVLAESVSQLRDPFMDIRYRNENANVGSYETRLDCLNQLAQVLDEVGKGKGEFGIMEAQFNDLLKQLENFNGKVGSVEYDTTVRGSAENLTLLFNNYAKSLQTVQDNELKKLKEDVGSVNTLLTRIRDLSEEIREAGIHGDKALELRDARNVCIDELSAYMKIDVNYDMEKIDEFSSVERINISIADSGTPPIKLIQGIYGAQLSMPDQALARNPEYDPDDPVGMKYISQETDLTAKPPKLVYTDLEREAMRRQSGALLENKAQDWTDLATRDGVDPTSFTPTYYDAAASKGMKYLDENGDPTDDPDQAALVDNAMEGSDENRLWMTVEPLVDRRGKFMRDQYHKEITESVDLSDTQLYGSLQSLREFLTEKGEFSSEEDLQFDAKALQKRGVLYYKYSLDALAKKFAEKFNEANTGPDGKPVVVGFETEVVNGVEQYKTQAGCNLGTVQNYAGVDLSQYQEEQKWVDLSSLPEDVQMAIKDLQKHHLSSAQDVTGALGHGYPITAGGVLFSNGGDNNDPTNITAANISIAKDWASGTVRILPTKNNNPLENTTANDNIYHMINLLKSEKYEFLPGEVVANPADGKKYFTGTFQERLADMNDILAVDGETTNTLYNSYTLSTLSLDNQRQSVSGVDLNDEATNMMVFQKSYAAACQLMTTLDSMLDKLINGTIR